VSDITHAVTVHHIWVSLESRWKPKTITFERRTQSRGKAGRATIL